MDLTDLIGSLGGAAGSVLGGLNNKGTPAPAAAAAPVATPSNFTTYLPWIIGGGVVLLVLAVVLGRR